MTATTATHDRTRRTTATARRLAITGDLDPLNTAITGDPLDLRPRTRPRRAPLL